MINNCRETYKSRKIYQTITKEEEATNYLVAEMKRIDLHLDKMLAPHGNKDGMNEPNSHTQEQTGGTTYTEVNSSENIIQDPDTTTQKGRPAKPKRMKTAIEEAKEKMKQKENKKKKTTSNVNSGRYNKIDVTYTNTLSYIYIFRQG
jgi:hypothetical protein